MNKEQLNAILESDELYQMKSTEVKDVRTLLLEKQDYKCAICGRDLRNEDLIALDHQHKNKKADPNGVNGDGLIRGVLCSNCNTAEGKIWNATKRFQGARTVEDRISFLELLIKYYKNKPLNLIHPNERIKDPKVAKSQFNKLIRTIKKDSESKLKKLPEYPKSGLLTIKLKDLFEKYNISPYLNQSK
jgi:5-methylcytosine-specific restriction endonuclease McrA